MTSTTATTPGAIDALIADRVIAVVRAAEIPDPAALADALVGGGIRVVELTFTTPNVVDCLAAAAESSAIVGAGTVLTGEQASLAIGTGAQFLVTPGLRTEVAEVAAAAGVPLLMGALSPSEVMTAMDLGAAAVKIFPARGFGQTYISDLLGPFPGARLVPSGGVGVDNALGYLKAGAAAVTAGTDVVTPDLVARGQWAEIEQRARLFTDAVAPAREAEVFVR
ncbi:bifunctional 4-hydroxy-2-oxoglutarate aldolase/2-dehydro-3-deoxy-phosphogluconate aldolase [Gordonia sp. NPDC003424]